MLLAVGVSVACFHAPAPAMIAKLSGPRVGKGMSIFMASGELGRALGPVFARGRGGLVCPGWSVAAGVCGLGRFSHFCIGGCTLAEAPKLEIGARPPGLIQGSGTPGVPAADFDYDRAERCCKRR
ncbi:MAG: hypothetical protein M5U34_25670 [Chloroflexi bacterium]|nr:hypothetical protein [Chloroflexota bacterium]